MFQTLLFISEGSVISRQLLRSMKMNKIGETCQVKNFGQLVNVLQFMEKCSLLHISKFIPETYYSVISFILRTASAVANLTWFMVLLLS